MDTPNQPVEPSKSTTPAASDLIAAAREKHSLSIAEVLAELESRAAAKSLPPVDPEWEAKQRQRIAEHEAAQRKAATEAAWREFLVRIGPRYSKCTVKDFERYGTPDEQARQSAVVSSMGNYGRALTANVATGAGILLYGPPGTGKDHLLAGLAGYAIHSFGMSVGFWYGLDMYGEARDRIDEDKSEAAFLRKFESPKILILSDPIAPQGDLTVFQSGLLTRIVNARYRLNRPTWVTINAANRKEMQELLGAQVLSRLEHNAITHCCAWPDYRSKKAGARA